MTQKPHHFGAAFFVSWSGLKQYYNPGIFKVGVSDCDFGAYYDFGGKAWQDWQEDI